MTFSRAIKVNVTVGAAATIATTNVDNFTYQGRNYQLSAFCDVGYFTDGSPFILSNVAARIRETSEPSRVVNGAVAYGMMKNPLLASQAGPGKIQGWDGYYGDTNAFSSLYNMGYTPSLNVDPGASDTASWMVGEKCTFVKSIRDPAKTSASDQFRTSVAFDFITVLDQAPPVGTVRPGHSGVTKMLAQVPADFTPRGYTLPASWGSVQEIIDNCPDEICHFTNDLVKLRFLRIWNNSLNGYSALGIQLHTRMIYALNASDTSGPQRDVIMQRILKGANDIVSLYEETGVISTDGSAGQGGIWWCYLMAAYVLTGNATYLTTANDNTQVDLASFWIDEAHVGASAEGSNGVSAQTYFAEQVGMPWVEPAEITSNLDGRYTTIGGKIVSWEVLSILGFNRPVGVYANGAEVILQGGANDTTNPYAAKLAWAARHRTLNPNVDAAYFMTDDWKDAWDQVAAFGDFVQWSGRPDQPPRKGNNYPDEHFFAPGFGAITLNTRGWEGETEPATRIDMEVSLDGVMWDRLEDINVSSGSFTWNGLLKSTEHWARWRKVSASGAGVWSPNYAPGLPIDSGNDANVLTTTGNQATTAPTYAGGVQPQIHTLIAPDWSYPKAALAAAGTLSANDIHLVCGVGYPGDCYPAPTFSNFQWMRNGANIPGATSKYYTRTSADVGAALTCSFDVSNGTTAITVETAAVTCPAVVTRSAGALIDTDFKGAFDIDYAAELASLTGTAATATRRNSVPIIKPGVNQGGIYAEKRFGNPSAVFELSRAADAGTDYDVSGQFAVVWPNATGRYYIDVIDGGDAILFSEELTTFASDRVFLSAAGTMVSYGVLNFAGQFTTGANTVLRVRMRSSQPTGGTSGGSMALTQLTIAQAGV